MCRVFCIIGVANLPLKFMPRKESSKAHTSPAVKHQSRTFEAFAWLVVLSGVLVWGYSFGKTFLENESFMNDLSSTLLRSDTAVEEQASVLGTSNQTSENDADGVSGDALVAQTDDEEEDVANLVDEIEEERRIQLEQLLQLSIPEETDDPNLGLTFVEPTTEGVEIQIDGGGFAKKTSPYALPSLAIGKHTINFRFKDSLKVLQNLEEILIVIPRAPQVADDQITEFIAGGGVEFHGTALPDSTLVYLVGSSIISGQTEVDADGNWSFSVEEELELGEHGMSAFVRKDGYASNFSNTFPFTVRAGTPTTFEVGDNDTSGNLLDTVRELIEEPNYYFLGGVGLFLLLVIVVLGRVFAVAFSRKKQEHDIEMKTDLLGAQAEKPVTLREKFVSVGLLNNGNGEGVASPVVSEQKLKIEAPVVSVDQSNSDKSDNSDKSEPVEPEKKPAAKKGKRGAASEPTEEVTEETTPEVAPEKGKVYSKEEFFKIFRKKEPKPEAPVETNKLKITLTSTKPE